MSSMLESKIKRLQRELGQLEKQRANAVKDESDAIKKINSANKALKGLANSRYGIVVISPTFIEKYWTNYELDGILDKESSTGTQMILPIWHNVTADQVKKYSHSLSNMLALNTALNTIDDIVENVEKILK